MPPKRIQNLHHTSLQTILNMVPHKNKRVLLSVRPFAQQLKSQTENDKEVATMTRNLLKKENSSLHHVKTFLQHRKVKKLLSPKFRSWAKQWYRDGKILERTTYIADTLRQVAKSISQNATVATQHGIYERHANNNNNLSNWSDNNNNVMGDFLSTGEPHPKVYINNISIIFGAHKVMLDIYGRDFLYYNNVGWRSLWDVKIGIVRKFSGWDFMVNAQNGTVCQLKGQNMQVSSLDRKTIAECVALLHLLHKNGFLGYKLELYTQYKEDSFHIIAYMEHIGRIGKYQLGIPFRNISVQHRPKC